MKPRIKIRKRQSVFSAKIWVCEGDHPDGFGLTCAFGISPAMAYREWLSFWHIPF
jgi:hypothetical protein